MSRFPDHPWRLDDTTTVARRLELDFELADDGVETPEVQRFAACIATRAAGKSRFELATAALNAVQALPYVPDPMVDGQMTESLQRPLYTLLHGGDCEDLAQLLMAVLMILGFDVIPVWLEQEGETQNHTTMIVRVLGTTGDPRLTRDLGEHGWNWAESTIKGARLGEHPYEAAERVRSWSSLGRRQVAA